MTNSYKDFNLKTALDFLVKNNVVTEDVLPSNFTLVEKDEIIDAILKGSDII